jgi:hypothetical protein
MRTRVSGLRLLNLLSIALLLTCVAGCASAQHGPALGQQMCWAFDDQTPQRSAKDWRIAATNPTAELATWQVLADPTAPSPSQVLALTRTDNYDGTFNLAIAPQPSFRDLELSVKVKPVAGKEDQGGGPIWRCQDENNYYICRLNPLESNFRVYVVSKGKRRQLDSMKVELSPDRWYEVHVRMAGNGITCELDGGHQLHAIDATIQEAGHVGLWTKADAVTSFDDLQVRTLAVQE